MYLPKISRNKILRQFLKRMQSVKQPSLPPTADAAFGHFKRVYLQIQTWLGKEITSEEWGWKYKCGMLIPQIMTHLPAPESLLKMIISTCKSGCGASFGCRKSRLNCTVACLECNG
ncbi:unnamed protein product, partial [Brenthis ino]